MLPDDQPAQPPPPVVAPAGPALQPTFEVPKAAFDAPPAAAPTLRSPDGRLVLTADRLIVRGQPFALRALERAELTPVRWILWYLLGGLGLASVMIAFLNNWLRTGPAMLGMALTALLLAYGRRGTNRLRLYLLGREAVNFALPGEPEPWLRLCRELNRRIQQAHDAAAHAAAALLAAATQAATASPPEPPAPTA